MRSYGREEDASDNVFWILLVCYIAECLCFSDTHKFLWNLTRDSALKPHIELVKRSRPIIKLKIQCYHFETHHWWETVKDAHGRERRVRSCVEINQCVRHRAGVASMACTRRDDSARTRRKI